MKEANGTITAEYPSITDTKERSIRFKVIVNDEAKAGETILNKAKVGDGINPPEEPEVPITPEEPAKIKGNKQSCYRPEQTYKNSKNEIAINKKETSKSSYLPKQEKSSKIFAYLGVGLILIVLILYVIKRNKEKEE